MKIGWKVYFLWCHMRSMELLSLLMIMTWLECHILYISRNILCYIMMIYIFLVVLMILLRATRNLHAFFAPYLVQILVEVLHSLLGWKNTCLIILMYIKFFWSIIMGHGILTYVIGIYLIILDDGVYGTHDDLLTWMYKHFHDCLMRYLLDEHLYDVAT